MRFDTIFSMSACCIDGTFVSADSGETFSVINPYDGSLLGNVPNAGAAETARAIEVAQRAFPIWKAKTARRKAEVLLQWYKLIMAHCDELARIVTTEQGKPLAEAKGEIINGASFIRWFAEETRRLYGDIVPGPCPDKRMLVTREPVGVVGVITPWNFPMSMIARKVSAALAAGCPVVIKPAPQTPFSALAMAELAIEAGLPKGTFNVVTGDAEAIGLELTTNPIVRKISFTGSTRVGKQLLSQAASTVKSVSMELGGNAPFIVFDDADIDKAAAGALVCKFRNSGQTCICANRFYIQDAVYDIFVEKLAHLASSLKLGNGLDPNVTMGPLIDQYAMDKMHAFTEDAKAKNGRIVCGGEAHTSCSLFYAPTVIADATDDMRFASEEIFGPIAPIFRFHDEAEVIARANNTAYGLAAYVYTKDMGRTWRASERLEYGLVGINDSRMTTCEAPFGGVKESGFGREGSRHGLDEYTTLKYTCMGGIEM
ncbi:NAD-dependent succinate-semialdehyde dehydrogenase [Desulfovibrio inopinatus]|uniref:NAD-dependent succinate-semialdehyde dehydrogenase n=1 Tax=Desulfovibrio inopinatus TaxID=102109 RepID=UPI000406FC03|nr:NAD-dependent succinate-semialdehyde dehydrogenase [Desulfovibrio inopinatus]